MSQSGETDCAYCGHTFDTNDLTKCKACRDYFCHSCGGGNPNYCPCLDASGAGPFQLGSRVWPGLAKVIEETGEVMQAGGKLLATGGGESHWDGYNLREWLSDEVADAIAALTWFARANGLTNAEFNARIERKMAQYEEWHVASVKVEE